MSAFFLLFSVRFAGEKKQYPASPPAKISPKWRIGYLEGEAYKDYLKVFTVTIRGLSELGWIEKISILPQEDRAGTGRGDDVLCQRPDKFVRGGNGDSQSHASPQAG